MRRRGPRGRPTAALVGGGPARRTALRADHAGARRRAGRAGARARRRRPGADRARAVGRRGDARRGRIAARPLVHLDGQAGAAPRSRAGAGRRGTLRGRRRARLHGRVRRLSRSPYELALVGGGGALGRGPFPGVEPGRGRARRAPSPANGPCGWTEWRTRFRLRASLRICRAWATCRSGPWASRDHSANRLLVRSRYRQPFGEFKGRLPGGVELAEGFGVMEEHEVWW